MYQHNRYELLELEINKLKVVIKEKDDRFEEYKVNSEQIIIELREDNIKLKSNSDKIINSVKLKYKNVIEEVNKLKEDILEIQSKLEDSKKHISILINENNVTKNENNELKQNKTTFIIESAANKIEIERLNDRCKRFEETVKRLRKERDESEEELIENLKDYNELHHKYMVYRDTNPVIQTKGKI